LEDLSQQVEPSHPDRQVINEMFRLAHTIKGISGTFGLFRLAEAVSSLENDLTDIREHGSKAKNTNEFSITILAELSLAFMEVEEEAKNILGEDLGRENGLLVHLPLSELKQMIATVNTWNIGEAVKSEIVAELHRTLLHRLYTWQEIPAIRGLGRVLKAVPRLLERMGKPIEFRCIGQDTPLPCEVANDLNAPLLHLLRNAFDHGIEPVEERILAGKNERGSVQLQITRTSGQIEIKLSDDGRGLDAARLRSQAVAKGFIKTEQANELNQAESLKLIMIPGFSTATAITEISGRGVGMDAVQSMVQGKLGGELVIESNPGQGTTFFIRIPQPTEMYAQAAGT